MQNKLYAPPPIGGGLPEKQEEPWPKATAHDKVFAWLIAAGCVIFVDFALFGGFNMGFSIAYALLFCLCLSYQAKDMRMTPFSLFCGAYSLLASAVFALYAMPGVNFVLFCSIVLAAAVFFIYACGAARYPSGGYLMLLDGLAALFYLPLKFAGRPFVAFFSKKMNPGKKGVGLKIFVGLLAAIPALMLVFPLLMASDAAFENIMKQVLNIQNLPELLFKILLGLVMAIFLFSAMYAMKKKRAKEDKTYGNPFRVLHVTDPVGVNAAMSAICAFYVLYLVAQLGYFFSAFSGFLPEGYTFTPAEYARRGFFEMCAISVINLFFVFGACVLVKRKRGNVPASTRTLALFMVAFNMVLIIAAISKMALYVGIFGMTQLRVFASVFMAAVFILCLALAVRLIFRKFPYMKVAAVLCALLLLTVGFADIDTCIARYNIAAYQSGQIKDMDVRTLGYLSDSAVPHIAGLLDDEDPGVRREAKEVLNEKLRSSYIVHKDGTLQARWAKRDHDFRLYNRSAALAKETLLQNLDDYFEWMDWELNPAEYYEDT